MELRQYQVDCLSSIRHSIADGHRRLLCILPTAAGKTVIFSHLIKDLKRKTLVIAHRTELLEQAKQKILMICPELKVGIINAHYKDFRHDVIIASIQSLYNRRTLLKIIEQNVGLIVYDEAHHAASDRSRVILKSIMARNYNATLLGFTATGFRNDSRGLVAVFDAVAYQIETKQLIEQGYLTPVKGHKIINNLDLSLVSKHDGDWSANSLAEVMNTREMNSLIVKAYLEHGQGKKAIVFACNIQHAQNLSNLLKAENINAVCIHGHLSEEKRNQIIADFRAGNIQVLTNCDILTEGYDDPSIECLVLARPTKSLGLFMQQVGRGLRKYPNKQHCIILDFNDENHSIINAAILAPDAEIRKYEQEREPARAAMILNIPAQLNQNLKSVLLDYDPVNPEFTWKKVDTSYFLKGKDGIRIAVLNTINDLYDVIIEINNKEVEVLGHDLSFDYAFGVASDRVKANRKLFVLADLSAPWRNQKATDAQLKILRDRGYKKGLEQLTKGQVSILLDSGVLTRNNRKPR